MRKIICPYCFADFEHDQVHFRLETVTGEGIDRSDIEYESDPGKRAELEQKMRFQPREDERYTRFWKDYGETTELTTNNERNRFKCEVYQLPVVDPHAPDAGQYLLPVPGGSGGGTNYFIYDGSGMVLGVKDVYGAETHRRVCPACHNPLPNGYGKNAVKFIAVIGVTGAGKTVYISQLLKKMAVYTHSLVSLSSHTVDDRVDNFIKNNRVERNVALPDSTMAGRLSQPMTFDIVRGDGGRETFVIYDIAGEDCVDAQSIEKYAKFVKKADGMILLISPKQVGFQENYVGADAADDGREAEKAPPREVLNTLFNTIVIGMREGEKCQTPIAVCISKSDFFADQLGAGEENGPEIVNIATKDVHPYEDPNTGEKSYTFNATEYNVIEKKIAKRMWEDPISGDLAREYAHYNYFIFSATGCPVRKEGGRSYPTEDPYPLRIAEPLLWLFKRFGYIRSNVKIRLPQMRGDPNQLVPTGASWFRRVFCKEEQYRHLTDEEKEALWYERTC